MEIRGPRDHRTATPQEPAHGGLFYAPYDVHSLGNVNEAPVCCQRCGWIESRHFTEGFGRMTNALSMRMNVADVAVGGTNVPVTVLPDIHAFDPSNEIGAERFSAPLGRGIELEALFVNKNSDTLLVQFHGSLDPRQTVLPRFERLARLKNLEHSVLFFSDPTHRLSEHELWLAWYTGWAELDLPPMLAQWAVKAAENTGAKTIVFTGGSGGGFAALQTSPYVPGSYAFTMNPQTAIGNYYANGTDMGVQRRYARIVRPEMLAVEPAKITPETNWSAPMGDRASVLEKYKRPQNNRVLYVQNTKDTDHWDNHYLPFKEVIEGGPNEGNVRFAHYDGPAGHISTPIEIVEEFLDVLMDWETEQPSR